MFISNYRTFYILIAISCVGFLSKAYAEDQKDEGGDAIEILSRKGAEIIPPLHDQDGIVAMVDEGRILSNTPWYGSEKDLQLLLKVPSVVELDLNYTVKDSKALNFLPEMRSLRRIFDPLGCIPDNAMQYVGQCRNLEVFKGMSGCSDKGFQELMKLKQLRRLSVYCPKITDKGIIRIAELKNLEELSLAGAKLHDQSLVKIATLPKIRKLDIASNENITDAGLRELHKCTSLRQLSINGKSFKPSSIEELRKALPNCKIEIYGVDDKAGSKADAEDQRSEGGEAIEILTRNGAEIIPHLEGKHGIVAVVGKDRFLSETIWRGSEKDLQLLVKVPAVVELHLNCTITDLKTLKFLAEMQWLRRLYVYPACSSDDAMQYNAQCGTLEGFEGFLACSDKGFQELMKLKNLRRLSVVCPLITDEGVARIDELKNMEELALLGATIGDESLEKIAKLPKLRTLNIAPYDNITDAGLQSLYKCTSLRELTLSGKAFSHSSIDKLRHALPNCKIEVGGGHENASSNSGNGK